MNKTYEHKLSTKVVNKIYEHKLLTIAVNNEQKTLTPISYALSYKTFLVGWVRKADNKAKAQHSCGLGFPELGNKTRRRLKNQ